MTKILTAPNGLRLIGTKELIPGVANVDPENPRNADGTPNYVGGTEVTWDEQKTVMSYGQRVWLDEDYEEHLESMLVLTEQDEDDE